MSDNEKKNKRKGAIASMIFHAVILILFAIFGMSYTVPPPEDGMLINFGYSDMGSGTVEEEPAQTSEQEEVVEEQESAVAPQDVQEVEAVDEVATQEVEQSVNVKKQEEVKKPVEEVKEPHEEVKTRC